MPTINRVEVIEFSYDVKDMGAAFKMRITT